MATLSLSIDGMTCAHCTKRVQVALRQVQGVSRARVNLMENLAMIDYDPEQASPGQLLSALREEGFAPGPALSLIHISEPTRPPLLSRMPSSA